MKITEYVPFAIRTEKPLDIYGRLTHSCMGLITEIGEVVSELKRVAIYEKPLDAARKVHIVEEIGDVMWYAAIMLDACMVDLTTVEMAPRLPHPYHQKGKYEALSLMLGKHCGRVCCVVTDMHTGVVEQEEIADLLASLCMLIHGMYILAWDCDSTIEQAMADNIAKLQVRYPDKYSNEAAVNRADKAEEARV